MKNIYLITLGLCLLICLFSCNSTPKETPAAEDKTEPQSAEITTKEKLFIIPSSTSAMNIKGSPKTINEAAFKWDSNEDEITYSIGGNSFNFNEEGYLTTSFDTVSDGVYISKYSINKSEGSITISRTNQDYNIGASESQFHYDEAGKLDSVFVHLDGDRDFYEKFYYNQNGKIDLQNKTFVKTKLSNEEVTQSKFSYDSLKTSIQVVNQSTNEEYTIHKEFNHNDDCIKHTRVEGDYIDSIDYTYQYDSLQNWIVKTIIIDGSIVTVIKRNYIYFE